ncbi:PP2C family protein-serine/threonine phosphatase [Actinacidiphila alni]|uniref:PP2C family protein-serine/threonine phosphatase n=1 Tax=Actinacidiphila alni TaxID=380248 RepID=UPI0034530B61
MDDVRSATPWPTAVMRWIPAAMIVAGVVFDLATPNPYTGDTMLAGACVLAGATQSARTALLTCGTAMAGVIALTVENGIFGSGIGLSEILNVLLSAVIGLSVNRVLARSGRRLATVRDVAESAQRALLPEPPGRLGPLAIAARYEAAQSGARIGGDVYAAEHTRYGVRLLIGDVRGKGMGAVATVSVLLGAFREAADEEPDLAGLAHRLDRALERDRARRPGEEELEGFATGLLAEFTPAGTEDEAGTEGSGRTTPGGRLRLLNRGHPPPYLLHGSTVRTLEPATPDLPFGMSALGGVRSAPDEVELPADATLLLVTDGVTEARDRNGVFYDPETRLPRLGPFGGPGRGPGGGPQQAIDVLLRDLADWTGGVALADDRAVLAVSPCPP